MGQPSTTDEAHYAQLIAAFRDDTAVTQSGKGFGATALKVHNKIFAMRSIRSGQIVLKLPRHRVEALIATGVGERFDPGSGRIMKEWVALTSPATEELLALAREALVFVAEQG